MKILAGWKCSEIILLVHLEEKTLAKIAYFHVRAKVCCDLEALKCTETYGIRKFESRMQNCAGFLNYKNESMKYKLCFSAKSDKTLKCQ